MFFTPLFFVLLVLVSFGAESLASCGCRITTKYDEKPKKKCDPILTMSAYEFLKALNTIIRSGDPDAHAAFEACNSKCLPKQVRDQLYKCSRKIVGHPCGPGYISRVGADPVLAIGIYDCISEHVKDVQYTPEEIDQQLAYEDCVRNVKVIGGTRQLYF